MKKIMTHGMLLGVILCLGAWYCGQEVLAQESTLDVETLMGSARYTDTLKAPDLAQPLDEEGKIGVAYLVGTEIQSTLDLVGPDGSVLYMDQNTRLLVQELRYSAEQQIRIARFSLLEGIMTAEAKHLDYPSNIFEVETPTVVAAFKFSSATFTAKGAGTTADVHDGSFDVRVIKNADNTVTHTANKVKTSIFLPSKDNRVEVEVGSLTIENIGKGDITVTIGGITFTMPPGSKMTVGDPDPTSGRVTITGLAGTITTSDGQSITTTTPYSFTPTFVGQPPTWPEVESEIQEEVTTQGGVASPIQP